MKSLPRSSNRTSTFQAYGCAVEGQALIRRARSTVHQLRRPPAWAFHRELLEAAQAIGVTAVVIVDLDLGGRAVTAPLADIMRNGISVDRAGQGAQMALGLAHWRPVFGPESTRTAPARRELQLSLFEVTG